ncbi:TonB family protein [Roseicella frigidaeris]|uniref:Protein TonB n=1 Tax=Roseicella frigidaeris TaxID=2230885 RepID=A0A327MF84_9PROT|nr:TonB family protein [Roseicella frigidaeris]RAI60734.1 energy transducer TonB [Roseicella frigidaeris]
MPQPPRAAPRWLAAAALALALHGAAFVTLVWVMPPPETPPVMVEGLEVTPLPEPVAEQPQETPEPPAEPVQAAEPPPEPVTTPPPPDAAPPPPPETVQAEPPPETQPPPPPEPLAAVEPEPMPTEPPPEMVESAEPEPVVAETPPMPPPPPPPPPRPRPTHVEPRPQPAAPSPPVAAAPAPAAAPPPAAAARPAGPPPSYIGALLAALNRHKQYPTSARLRRAEGVVMLRFAMRRDGTVMRWRVERSSGHPDLDEAVGVMVNAASPLPAPPPDLPGDPVELVVPVRFSLR